MALTPLEGKSTLCLKLLAEALGSVQKAKEEAKRHILSTDDFFIDAATGAYNFNNGLYVLLACTAHFKSAQGPSVEPSKNRISL